MARVDFRGLEQFAEKLNALNDEQINQFNERAIKELAARLLRKVILRTPVGDYSGQDYTSGKSGTERHIKGHKHSGKMGGTLRRGWTSKTQEDAKSRTDKGGVTPEHLNGIKVTKQGNSYVIEIINPVEYASYVEFGHRTRDHKGWVEGRFMLTMSEQELEADAPRILENKLNKFFGELFK